MAALHTPTPHQSGALYFHLVRPVQVLSQLFEQVRRRDSFALIRPEMVVANEYGDVSLQEISEADQGSMTSSAFIPPEMASAALLDAVDAEGRKAAYVWNLGVTVYALLAGYPPFASTSVTECPFFADFATSHRLACPPHFSTAAIELLLDMLCVEPAGRIRFEALERSIDEWRRSAMVQTEPDIERKTMIRARSDSNVSAILAALALRSSAPPSARLSSSPITAAEVSSAGDMAAAQTVAISAAHPVEIPQVASALSGNGSRGKAPACGWTLASACAGTGPVTSSGCPGSPSDGDSSSACASVEASPMNVSPHATAAASAASSSTAADAAAFLPPPPPAMSLHTSPAVLDGPHGVSAEMISRSLIAHPNSPRSSAGMLARPNRPVAVMYSPSSDLPRKVSASFATSAGGAGGWAGGIRPQGARESGGGSSTSGGALPPEKRSRVKIKRLGWDVACPTGEEGIHAAIVSALGAMAIPYQPHNDPVSGSFGVLTGRAHYSDGMGPGTMQASILVTSLCTTSPLAQSQEKTRADHAGWRIDVTRFTGDTFQFHAFYRALRDHLRPLFIDEGGMASFGAGPAMTGPMSAEACMAPTHSFWGARGETNRRTADK